MAILSCLTSISTLDFQTVKARAFLGMCGEPNPYLEGHAAVEIGHGLQVLELLHELPSPFVQINEATKEGSDREWSACTH